MVQYTACMHACTSMYIRIYGQPCSNHGVEGLHGNHNFVQPLTLLVQPCTTMFKNVGCKQPCQYHATSL